MKRVLVTGANGFIGRELVTVLAETCSVRAAVRDMSNIVPGTFSPEMDVVSVGNISTETDWSHALEDVDTVVHLAARAHVTKETCTNPIEEFLSVNCNGAVALLQQASAYNVSRFVFISSIGVNGNATYGTAFSEEQSPNPVSDYAISKYEAEQQLKLEAEMLGIELVIVRPALVYGKGAPGNIERLSKLVKMIPVLPFGLVSNRKSFVFIDNLTSLIKLCVGHPSAVNQIFLAADNQPISTKHLINILAKAEGGRVIQLPVPVSFMRFAARILGKSTLASQLFDDLVISNEKAKTLLGWNPVSNLEMTFSKKH
ncbi:NAD-dependent epimerase/dehydratase family protein [Photobacterium makurazakiensis]|uniref:NAD-dependent epimerase/dehydratase family protein n=1 Tax=Photobacterium makurazakiensis TaxID=2910234 RepID=UPI003D0E6821